MPDAPEHPVTLGDLRIQIAPNRTTSSFGYRPATVADLVSALRAEGVLEATKLISYAGSGPQMFFRYVLNLPGEPSALEDSE